MGRAAVPSTHGSAASHKLAQGVCNWVCQRHGWFPCLGSQCKPHQKKSGKQGLGLGHQSIKTHNNQLRVGFCNRLDAGEKARWLGSVGWDVVVSFGTANGRTIFLMKYTVAFRWPPINKHPCNNQPKTGSRNRGEYEGEVWQAGGKREARYHDFGRVIS